MSNNQNTTVIGLDPGGQKAFGWCIMTISSEGEIVKMEKGTGSFIDSIIDRIASELDSFNPSIPSAVGIDAPLYWSTAIQGSKSERVSDRLIRQLMNPNEGVSSSVLHVNSLRGACLVNGILSIVRLREKWSKIKITEAHPGALKIIVPEQIERFIESRSPKIVDFPPEKIKDKNNHEYDAAIAAFSAWKMIIGSEVWTDLIIEEKKDDKEKEKLFFPAGENIAYWFPNCVIPESEK